MTIDTVITVVILAFDFIISIWNGYASGYNIGLIRKGKANGSGGGFSEIAAYSGLGLAFVGIVYVLVIVLSYVLYWLGYVGSSVVNYALAFNFLVFGLMIIGFGLMVTIQSIILAYRKRSIWSILIAIFNTVVIIFDVVSYASAFGESVQLLKGNRQGSGNAYIIVIVAILIGFFIIHAAYKQGLKKAASQVQMKPTAT